MPPGMYQAHEAPYQEGPPPQAENVQYADYIAKGDIPGPIQRYWRPQQGQGSHNQGNYNNNQGNYNNNYDGPNQGRYNNNNNNGSLRFESMLEKVLASQTNTEKTLSKLSETVVSLSAAIQNLEQQMRDLSREHHPARKGADQNVVDIEPIIEEDEVRSEVPIIDEEVQGKEKVDDIPEVAADTGKHTIKGALRPLTQMDKEKPPFPQMLANKNDDAKYVVKEMPGFAKFVKDLLTKKRSVKHETVNLTHRLSSIIASTKVQKKGDPGAFTIPCNIGLHAFARALCDNGMADISIKKPIGIINDVLVLVDKFMLPADFVILDCAVDRDIPIILGRPFLATGRALMDSE
ncbi:uncharacterized protein LOC132630874 [Lycium barbarum]|uniref:uncharacterized protein LOC132630874 n=1 Tax=Lycium barbarum TaxID=112863 RepID=UPI00293E30D5|nr:uncharacterized protein LOC132630874 [Lycium barbarum]